MNSVRLARCKSFFVLCFVVVFTGCAIIYEQDVQQGNVITDEMLDNLQPGMSKTEVQYYLGTPLIEDPFHANRWDYYYTFQEGGHKKREHRLITLLFDQQDRLTDISGDIQTSETQATAVSLPDEGELNTVVSDTEQSDETFWQSIKRRILRQ